MTAIANEKEVRAALDEARETDKPSEELLDWMAQYMCARSYFDPKFNACVDSDDLAEAAEDTGDADLDFYGDTIVYQWSEYARCGDYDYHRVEFPIQHLWADRSLWEAQVTEANRLEKERKERERREAEEKRRKAQEERERKQLRELAAKYPDEITHPYVPGSLG